MNDTEKENEELPENLKKMINSFFPLKYFALKMYVSIAFLFLIQFGILYLFIKLNYTIAERLFTIGLSILSVCIYKLSQKPSYERVPNAPYWAFIVFLICGFSKFDWYIPIFSIFFLSLPLGSFGKIIWIRMVVNNSDFRHLHWINIFTVSSFFITLTGLLIH